MESEDFGMLKAGRDYRLQRFLNSYCSKVASSVLKEACPTQVLVSRTQNTEFIDTVSRECKFDIHTLSSVLSLSHRHLSSRQLQFDLGDRGVRKSIAPGAYDEQRKG